MLSLAEIGKAFLILFAVIDVVGGSPAQHQPAPPGLPQPDSFADSYESQESLAA